MNSNGFSLDYRKSSVRAADLLTSREVLRSVSFPSESLNRALESLTIGAYMMAGAALDYTLQSFLTDCFVRELASGSVDVDQKNNYSDIVPLAEQRNIIRSPYMRQYAQGVISKFTLSSPSGFEKMCISVGLEADAVYSEMDKVGYDRGSSSRRHIIFTNTRNDITHRLGQFDDSFEQKGTQMVSSESVREYVDYGKELIRCVELLYSRQL